MFPSKPSTSSNMSRCLKLRTYQLIALGLTFSSLSSFSEEAKTEGNLQSLKSVDTERSYSVPELSTTILIGVGGVLLIFRKRRIG